MINNDGNFDPEKIKNFRESLMSQWNNTPKTNESKISPPESRETLTELSSGDSPNQQFHSKYLEFKRSYNHNSISKNFEIIGDLFKLFTQSKEPKEGMRDLLVNNVIDYIPSFRTIKSHIQDQNKQNADSAYLQKSPYDYFHSLENENIFNSLFKANEFDLIGEIVTKQLNSTSEREAPARMYLLNTAAIRINKELESILNEKNGDDLASNFNQFLKRKEKLEKLKPSLALFNQKLDYDIHDINYNDQDRLIFYETELSKQIQKLVANSLIEPDLQKKNLKSYEHHLSSDIFLEKELALNLRLKLLDDLKLNEIFGDSYGEELKKELIIKSLSNIDINNSTVKTDSEGKRLSNKGVPDSQIENLPNSISKFYRYADEDLTQQIEKTAIQIFDNTSWDIDSFQRIFSSLFNSQANNMIDKFKEADINTENFTSFKGSILDLLEFKKTQTIPSLDQKLKNDLDDLIFPFMNYKDQDLSIGAMNLLRNYINKAENLRQFNLITTAYKDSVSKETIPKKYEDIIKDTLAEKADEFFKRILAQKSMELNIGHISELSNFINNLKTIKPEIRESTIKITLDALEQNKVSFNSSLQTRNIKLDLESQLKKLNSNQASF